MAASDDGKAVAAMVDKENEEKSDQYIEPPAIEHFSADVKLSKTCAVCSSDNWWTE